MSAARGARLLSEIPSSGNLVLELDTDACTGEATEVNYLEHVQAVVTFNSTRRGDTTLYLVSPSGTQFVLLLLSFLSSLSRLVNRVDLCFSIREYEFSARVFRKNKR